MDTTNDNAQNTDNTVRAGLINNPELERTVVASLITSYRSIVDTSEILYDDCFFDEKMKEIYQAVKAIYNRGDAPDMILVSSELAKNGSSITAVEIADICVNSSIPLDLVQHALILRDYSFRRKLFNIGNYLISMSPDEKCSVESLQLDCRNALDGLFDFGSVDLSTLEDTYKDLINVVIENQNRREGEVYGTPTGFDEIDQAGGLCGTDLIVVGAETSQGKTSFATTLTLSAIQHGDGVAFYSMEMLPIQLTARIAAMRTGISSNKILRTKLEVEEFNKIGQCMTDLDMTKLYFDGKSNSSIDSILMSIRRMKMKKDIKGAVVDYLQLVKSTDGKLNREQAIGDIARSFKNLAKDLNIWIILISQLSRDKQNPYPTLSRLRDSGQIEEAADVIYLIYRSRDGRNYPEPFADISTNGTAMISVAKGRHIGTTQFICGFKPETTCFYPVSQQELSTFNFSDSEIKGATYSIEEEAPF